MKWLNGRRKRRNCFHHDHLSGDSWIRSVMTNLGMGKMFWCRECERTWFV